MFNLDYFTNSSRKACRFKKKVVVRLLFMVVGYVMVHVMSCYVVTYMCPMRTLNVILYMWNHGCPIQILVYEHKESLWDGFGGRSLTL